METTFYTKDFDGWNIQKKGLENKISDLFFLDLGRFGM
jgi:hypothetical protein